MKNYLVIALALQLEGETENLKVLHHDLGTGTANAQDYDEAAEKLIDAATALYSVVFDVVSRIWNINRPPEDPLKSYPKATIPKAAVVRGMSRADQAAEFIRTLPEEVQKELLAKLSRDTKQS